MNRTAFSSWLLAISRKVLHGFRLFLHRRGILFSWSIAAEDAGKAFMEGFTNGLNGKTVARMITMFYDEEEDVL